MPLSARSSRYIVSAAPDTVLVACTRYQKLAGRRCITDSNYSSEGAQSPARVHQHISLPLSVMSTVPNTALGFLLCPASSPCMLSARRLAHLRQRRSSRQRQMRSSHAHCTASCEHRTPAHKSSGCATAAAVLAALLSGQPACADVGELFTRNCAGDTCDKNK